MGSPGQHDFRAFHHFMLFDGNQVGKGLKGMYGGCFHGEDRTARVFDKLIQHCLGIVILAISETCKGTYANQVAVAAHHGNGL